MSHNFIIFKCIWTYAYPKVNLFLLSEVYIFLSSKSRVDEDKFIQHGTHLSVPLK